MSGSRCRTPNLEYAGPEHLRELRDQYAPSDGLPLVDGRVPLISWTDTPNYGDLLSPWLVGRVAQRPVTFAPPRHPSYVAVGSRGDPGPRRVRRLGLGLLRQRAALPVQVLGPVPRRPRPAHAQPAPRRGHRLPAGVRRPGPAGAHVLLAGGRRRPTTSGSSSGHSEHLSARRRQGHGAVKVIDFGSSDIDTVTREILSCQGGSSRSSLHGLVIADAYGLPERAGSGTRRARSGGSPGRTAGESQVHRLLRVR